MEKTQKKIFGFRLFVILTFAVTGWALIEKTGVANSDEAGIVLKLPDQVGPWEGTDLLFCSNRDCGHQFSADQLDDPTTCPLCGSPLDTMNWAERKMLPADTGLVRKYYHRPGEREGIHATIVLSGNDRSSIHRPEVCMTAAGNEIMEERTIRVPVPGQDDLLQIRVLDMSKQFSSTDGKPVTSDTYFAYWFVGKGRETASHCQRMIWMALDRMLHGISHRWAYIALSGPRVPGSDAHLQEIANFASRLHPALLKPE